MSLEILSVLRYVSRNQSQQQPSKAHIGVSAQMFRIALHREKGTTGFLETCPIIKQTNDNWKMFPSFAHDML